jgi:hypothetical protein
MSKQTVTLRCVKCGREARATAHGDAGGNLDVDWPAGWQGIVRMIASAASSPIEGLCPSCNDKKKR